MTKEDAQSLELITLERMYYASRNSWSLEASNSIDALRKILAIKRKGKAIIDEAHEVFDPNQELNYPLGIKSRIKNSYYQIIEKTMRLAVSDPRITTLLAQNNLPRLDMTVYLDEITTSIAEDMLNFYAMNLKNLKEEQKVELVQYMTGKLEHIPQWIQDHPSFPKIALVRGVLVVLLKDSLNRLIGVNYDASKIHEKEEYARPSDGNNNVKEESCIRSPYEAMVRTFLMVYCKGLDAKQCQNLITVIRDKAKQEQKTRGIALDKTKIYINLSKVVPGVDIFDEKINTYTDEQLKLMVNTLGKHPDAIQLYVRAVIHPQIPYWKLNIRSNAQNYASQYDTVLSDTGTPYNYGTYPSECLMKWTPGTIGEALHIIKEKCPDDGIFVLKADSPKESLQEMLDSYFQAGSDFTAIIDGGALFKGLSNEKVAKKMLKHAETHLPHIQAVKYYRKDEQGRDKLVWWEKGAKTWSEVDEARIPPEKCLTYFDDPHGFAADITQKFNGIGLETIGELDDQILAKILQDVFRMRGLKDKKRVVSGADVLPTGQRQSVRFAMPLAVKNKIFGAQKPTWEGIIMYGIANEAAKAKVDNYKSQVQKIQNVVRRAVLDKIIFAESHEEAMSYFKEFKDVFVSPLQDDPVTLYALIEKKVPYKDALEAAVEDSWKHISKTWKFTRKEKTDIRAKMDALANPEPSMMPERVSAYSLGDKLQFDVLDDHGKETQVNQYAEEASEVENENENENENQNENELQQQVNNQQNGSVYPILKWPEELDFFSKDWMQFTPYDNSYLASFKRLLRFGKKQLQFPLFKMRDLVQHSANDTLREVAGFIDKRLWATNHFIPQQVPIGSSPVEVGSKQQRHLLQVLIHFEELPDAQLRIDDFGLLGIHDAAQWRKYLRKMSPADKDKKQKVLLYDVTQRGGACGSHVDLTTLRKNKKLLKLEATVKFLNGDVDYEPEHIDCLRGSIQKHGYEKMRDAFTQIHADRGVKAYNGSDICALFDSFINTSWIDRQ